MSVPVPEDDRPIDRLLAVMRILRDPVVGCPWDQKQTFETIAPYTIEEAYEVRDALERGDLVDFRAELGDLLLQVVYQAQIADERGLFDFEAVAAGIVDKMVRRHPHVFEGQALPEGGERRLWEDLKAAERAAKGQPERPASVLDDVPVGFPALARAEKLQKRAARVGFDWGELGPVVAKIREELAEVEAAGDPEHQAEEVGDLLFAVTNLARHLKVDPEEALRRTNAKFERRFRAVEAAARAAGREPAECSLAELDAWWDEAKATERAAKSG
ncbi:MAG TPA: nucleoside triphosphate pyrophosphohydrolase [Geminicoccus sp.]|uniref:nucleoside triphosphate pyrophosphohydrolase n=1 Tax=Geminicoccus sp. TaxID=2024832 RepID=UPI002CE6A946|nr:nucleoside triphosphate pyrophosphohydrolase [Geminicoccus sp.]HWL70108.1 nucleoside triphosphate pyrophosphohydrolase [Geminicoccus sp.]